MNTEFFATSHQPSFDFPTGSLVDTHCHLEMAAYQDDLDQVLDRAFSHSINCVISIGTDLASSARSIELARNHPRLAATIGIHPHEVDGLGDRDYKNLEILIANNPSQVVAIGEIGLDYFYQHSSIANQQRHFRKQLDLAHDWGLPVIIHNRNADDDLLGILQQAKPLNHGGIMHCFSGDLPFAKKVLDLGLMISISGVITFKKSERLQEVVRHIPLASMVLETDGPYLAPHPHRGKRNEPAFLRLVAEKVAELRQITMNELADQTTSNARAVFRLNQPNGL